MKKDTRLSLRTMNQYTYSCSGVEKPGNEVTKLRVDQLAWALWSLPVVVGKFMDTASVGHCIQLLT